MAACGGKRPGQSHAAGDDADVAERLREVADELARRRVDLLRQQATMRGWSAGIPSPMSALAIVASIIRTHRNHITRCGSGWYRPPTREL
jgi:hypothetical protein